ncbi:TPA: hypothetical protein N0F65_012154 [Lagenidium giganteum]|uniref:Uncharacterized protein n=1 Tax=Lagenidium giganteum TaxID=4803 RepID=A0AAV2YUC4_9STRA|nr:TPA: hypothetical protein N0F65_012154 [Lagenidium giganteum]
MLKALGHQGVGRRCGCALASQPSRWSLSVRVRAMCTADEDKYLELKQLRDIKSEAFYEQQSEHRRYFYYVDLQGRLFLENTRPKNIATSLKSAKFLRFFFSQLRPNRLAPADDRSLAAFLEYPFRSPCGKEMNFIKCADRPLVFEDLRQTDEHDATKGWHFVYGGGELTMPFDPAALRISLSTGRLYHTVVTKHFPAGVDESIGLVRSQLAVELSKHIYLHEDSSTDAQSDTHIGDVEWQGQRHPLHSIP